MSRKCNIQEVLDYIEKNLMEELDLKHLAEKAYMSPYHFLRVFQQHTGEKPMDYVKRRRLTQASFKLVETDLPIIQIAMDHGYNSQEAFHRSFKKVFHSTPHQYRRENIDRIGSIMTKLNLVQEGIKPLGIIKEPKLHLLGHERIFSGSWQEYGREIWKLFNSFETKLLETRYPLKRIRFYFYTESLEDEGVEASRRVFLGVDVNENHSEYYDMMELIIPQRSYLVFEHRGEIDKLIKFYDRLNKQILPSQDEEIDPQYSMELYDERMYGRYFNQDMSWKEEVFPPSHSLPDRSNWRIFSPDCAIQVYIPLKNID